MLSAVAATKVVVRVANWTQEITESGNISKDNNMRSEPHLQRVRERLTPLRHSVVVDVCVLLRLTLYSSRCASKTWSEVAEMSRTLWAFALDGVTGPTRTHTQTHTHTHHTHTHTSLRSPTAEHCTQLVFDRSKAAVPAESAGVRLGEPPNVLKLLFGFHSESEALLGSSSRSH